MSKVYLKPELNKFLKKCYKKGKSFPRDALSEEVLNKLSHLQLITPDEFTDHEMQGMLIPIASSFKLTIEGEMHVEQLLDELRYFWRMSLHDCFVAAVGGLLGVAFSYLPALIRWIMSQVH